MSGAGAPASVVFVCDFAPGFDGAAFHGPGVGGTESLVVVLAEALAARGMQVSVATRVQEARSHSGVRYVPIAAATGAALVVLIKLWSDSAANLPGTRVFLATDVHVPDPAGLARCLSWAGVSAAISPYMRGRLAAAVDVSRMQVLAPPIRVADYASAPATREPILLYCSVPDRGLYYLKDLFPAIRRKVPGASLVITSDFSLWGRVAAKDAFLRFFDGQPGIDYLGHVSRAALVEQQRRARVMAYPCTFEEGFCIAAAECMAAGAVPVTTRAFALETTVGEAGVLVGGRPRSWFYRRAFVKQCVRLLTDERHWQAHAAACRRHITQMCDPAAIVDQILMLVAAAEARA